MQKKYTLYIGLNDKDAGRQLLETSEAVARVLDICGDCTYSVKSGVWTDDNGETVRESTIVVEMLLKPLEAVRAMVAHIKAELNQDAVAVQIEDVESFLL